MLIKSLLKKSINLKTSSRLFSSQIQKKESSVPTFSESIQFSKNKIKDFGELPRGEIPFALNFSPEHKITKLSNEIKVATEVYSANYATVSVFIKAGSRFETIENSGSSHFLTYLLSKSSKSKNRTEFQKVLYSMGAHVEITNGREIIGITLKVVPSDVPEAIKLLSEALTAPDFNENQIEADKEFVHRRILDVSRDQFEHSKESLFYTTYRDHMMGQSKYGIRDNIPLLKPAQIEEFYQKHVVGSSTVFVITGKFEQEQVVDLVQKQTATLPAQSFGEIANVEKPFMTPSTMQQRDDEMYNLNVATGYVAPAFGDKDFFAMKYFEKILGNYNAAVHGHAHLNNSGQQYNEYHSLLGPYIGVNLSFTEYHGFSDVGLFINYLHGNDFWAKELMYIAPYTLSSYVKGVLTSDVFRARSELFNELLAKNSSKQLNEDIAREVIYTGRRIPRSEYALRYSHLADSKCLSKIAFDYFYDKEIGRTYWGPMHNIAHCTYYGKKLTDSTKANSYPLL